MVLSISDAVYWCTDAGKIMCVVGDIRGVIWSTYTIKCTEVFLILMIWFAFKFLLIILIYNNSLPSGTFSLTAYS